jgi:hypothetical protein
MKPLLKWQKKTCPDSYRDRFFRMNLFFNKGVYSCLELQQYIDLLKS